MPLKTIRKPGSPHWHIVGTTSGRRYRLSSRSESKAVADAMRMDIERDAADRRIHGPAAVTTFAEAVAHYLRTGGEAQFLPPLVKRWGKLRVQQITPEAVARAAHELYPGRKASTHVRAVYTPANAVLARAAAALMCAPQVIPAPTVKAPLVQAADDTHIRALLPHCNPRLACMVLFLTLTGARIAEACRLEWAHVDFDRAEATLTRTKTGKPRRLALAAPVLTALKRLAEGAPASGSVFGYSDRWSARNALQRASARAGLPFMSSHKVGRHAFAARMLRAGHSLPVTQAAGGWASTALVVSTYGHLEHSHVDAAVRSTGSALLTDDN